MRRPVGRWPVVLAAAAVWAAAVPWLARLLGAPLDVPARLEVIDHVVPGAVVLLAALAVAGDRVRPGDLRWSVASGATSLAGSWAVTTHLPLLVEALDGTTAWDAAALHLGAGLPALLVGLTMLLLPLVHAPRR